MDQSCIRTNYQQIELQVGRKSPPVCHSPGVIVTKVIRQSKTKSNSVRNQCKCVIVVDPITALKIVLLSVKFPTL